MNILGIETSCDETAISLLSAEGETDFSYDVLGEALLSQIEIHKPYGGVYPNIAKREHARALVPILEDVLRQANMLSESGSTTDEETIAHIEKILEREPDLFLMLSNFLRSIDKPPVDVLAVTVGPGLEPALWVGINFARALHEAWKIPVVAVNHMEGHIMMALQARGLQKNENQLLPSVSCKLSTVNLPALALLVSGGHTELVLIPELMTYQLLGQTRDDASGEAFDKCARLLGLPYPGGPEIGRLAAYARSQGLERYTVLPRPMLNTGTYEFSFSGLKTAVRRAVEGKTLTDDQQAAMAREIEDAIVEVLVTKTKRAVEEHGIQTVIVGGGVSANSFLRAELIKALHPIVPLFPEPTFATDNARMIALAGYLRAIKAPPEGGYADPATLKANGNLRLA